ncbi:TAF-domain-containing protein [Auriculariales sp. MPI-PUGE-AT-0066]|nr:TAF-domain-containing protein [Auriculariales sp. MPI-PUGE-AT-0066]
MSTPSKPVLRAPPVGVFKPDAIRDVAESIGLHTLPEGVAAALASDVEYRIHQIVQQLDLCGTRGEPTLTTSDIDNALRMLNPPFHAPFRRAPLPIPGGHAPVYFVEDTEVDFDRALHEEKVFLPKPVSWTAHWLAIEGVQPLVPENPPPAKNATTAGGTSTSAVPVTQPRTTKGGPAAGKKPQAKTVLSRELQLYYSRLTTSLTGQGANDDKRAAALASLRSDAGLQALLPFLVRWAGERVQHALKANEPDALQLQVALDVLGAVLANPGLFVEPYLHQMLPPLLSLLLTSTLPATEASLLRTQAAQTMSRVITAHGTTYPTLGPRVTKTLLVALLGSGKSSGAREGAVRGLTCLGREAVRMGLFDANGLRLLADEHASDTNVVEATLDALRAIHPSSANTSNPYTPPVDSPDAPFLREVLGEPFASRVLQDPEWSAGLAKELRPDNLKDDISMSGLMDSGALESALASLRDTAGGQKEIEEFEMVDADSMEQIA